MVDRSLSKQSLFSPCDQDSSVASPEQLESLQLSFPISLTLLEHLSRYSSAESSRITQLLDDIITSASYYFPDLPFLFDRFGLSAFVPDDNQYHKLNWKSLIIQYHISLLIVFGWSAFETTRRTTSLDDLEVHNRVQGTTGSRPQDGTIRRDYATGSFVQSQQRSNIGTFSGRSGVQPSFESLRFTFIRPPSTESLAINLPPLEIQPLFNFQVNCSFEQPLFRALVLAVIARGVLDRPLGYLLQRELADRFSEASIRWVSESAADPLVAFDDFHNNVLRCLLEASVEDQIGGDVAKDRVSESLERIAGLEPFVTVPHSLEFLESLLAPLCYHENPIFAGRALVLYSHLQAGHSLELSPPEVVTAKTELKFDSTKSPDSVVLVYSPGPDGSYANVLSGSGKSLVPTIPGFYDYCWGRLSPTGIVEVDQSLPAGRYIVLPAGARKELIHEVPAFDERGPIPFEALESSVKALAESGVTVIHVTGAIERNGVYRMLSVTDHAIPARVCGGAQKLSDLCAAAARFGIRVVVDFLPLLALTNWSRKYTPYQTMVIDRDGAFRTGSIADSDLMLMNFRSPKYWDLLINETLQLCEQAGVGGFYLGNLENWDFVFPRNLRELLRIDPDGELHYVRPMIIEGAVVNINPESRGCGLLSTNARNSPFFAKLLRKLWLKRPDAFVWISCSDEHSRFVVESGLIADTPSFTQLCRDAINHSLQVTELNQVTAGADFRAFFERRASQVPRGALFVSTYESLIEGPLGLSLEGLGLILDCLIYLADVPVIGGVLPNAMYVPTAYQIALPDLVQIKKWSPPSGRFSDMLRHRTYLRMKTEWVLNGDLTPLPVSFNFDPVNAILAVARVCPNTKKCVLICISFFPGNLIYEVALGSLEAIRTQPQDAVISFTDVLLPSERPVYYEVSELASTVTGAYLDTMKLETHIYELTLCPQHRTDIDRRLWENVTTRLQRAIDFQSLSVLSRNRLFGKLLQFIEQTPSASELGDLIGRLPVNKERSSIFLKALFVASRNRLEGERLIPIADDQTVEEREDKLLAVMKIIRDHSNPDIHDFGETLYDENKQGPVLFIAPELGPFSKVGGLSTMVWELAKELIQLGLDIHVVSPYYNVSPKGETGYLKQYGVEYKFNVDVYCPDLETIGIHFGIVDGVKCWFIHHFSFFAAPYQTGSTSFRLKTMVIMARAPLEICCQIRLFPSVIVTNDWMTGLVPAYGRNLFGEAFSQTRFLHIFHNLGVGYAGKLWPNDGNPWAMQDIHQLPNELIIDQFDHSFDPSLSALLCTDQWATVSKKYRDELLESSPYNYFLSRFPQPFAYSNGIRLQERLAALTKLGLSHDEAKRSVQQKFFGEVDDNKFLLLFIGRIVEQKGVFLIIDSFEELHRRFDGRIQYIVGGQAAPDDRAYGMPCTQRMWDLKQRFPKHFWADPSAFFTDGLLCCQAADLMLVPSLFEPSGIVQQESFASGCPVLAFKTGGLADTVFEFDPLKKTGNGFVFWAHRHRDYAQAVERALAVFNDKEEYALLRKNARESVLSTEKVAREWAREFARLFKRFYEPDQPNKEFVLKIPEYAHH